MATLFARTVLNAAAGILQETVINVSVPAVETTMQGAMSSAIAATPRERAGWGSKSQPFQSGALMISNDGCTFSSDVLVTTAMVDVLGTYIERGYIVVTDVSAPGVPLTRANLKTLKAAN